MSVVLFLHLFSYFVFFSHFLTNNFNGQTVGNHGSTETYWWLWVTSLNHISKESHKDGSRDGMWSTTMYWFSAYKLISAGIFFCLALTKASCWIRLLRLHFSMSCYTRIYWFLVPYFFFAAQNDLISCCTVHGGICSSCAPLKLPY